MALSLCVFTCLLSEAQLRKTLLGSAGPLALHTRQFQYAGELRKTGGLRFLGSRITQSALPTALLDQVSVLSCAGWLAGPLAHNLSRSCWRSFLAQRL